MPHCRLLAGLVVLLVLSRPAAATDFAAPYEAHLIAWALAQTGLTIDLAPSGKRIARIVILREKIIAPTDPWPLFFNIIHIKTREHIVRQELLIREGDLWDEIRVAESERNLRALSVLAVARTVACQAEQPDETILLVVTKDLWSLRFNSSFNFTGTTINQLDLFPTETNFLGRNKQVGVHFGMSQQELFGPNRDHFVFGQRYVDPRILGSRLAFSEAIDLYLNGRVPVAGQSLTREMWQPDQTSGSFGGVEASIAFGRPLYALATPWAFSLSASASSRQIRAYRQNSGDGAPPVGERQGISLRTVTLAAGDSGETEVLPRVYHKRAVGARAAVTRSFGLATKHDLTVGLSVLGEERTVPGNFSIFTEAARDAFIRTVIPRSTSTARLFAGVESRGTTYIRLQNIQTFALSEDYLLGHQINLDVAGGLDLADAAQSFFQASATLAYRWYRWDSMLTVALCSAARYQPELAALDLGFDGQVANVLWGITLRQFSPLIYLGRLHLLIAAQLRHNDLNRSVATLGADPVLGFHPRPGDISFLASPGLAYGGLRGYPGSTFEGQNIFRINLEYRTLPVNLWTFHAGAVAFYDGGSVFGGTNPNDPTVTRVPFTYHHSLGFGLRGNFPQFDRQSFRLDIGFPLSGDHGNFGTWIAASFGQIF